jgi:simple sugar transport system permease protein
MNTATAMRARLAGENNEGFVALALVALFVAVGLAHPGFWSLVTVFSVIHNSLETLLFALGFFLVLLTGGIDVSFDAIGIFTGYSVALMAGNGVFNGDAFIAVALAVGLGLGLGALNALAAAVLRLPVLIVTLGTRGLFWGVMLTWIGSDYVPSMPGWLGNLNNWNLVYAHSAGQAAGLNWLVIPVAVICVCTALFLRRTMTGRGFYAIGGSEEAARRAGFPVVWTRAVAFLLAGVLAALAGLVHVGLINEANPQDLVGNELVVIAAVVVGGASIFGGKGSVTGTILGVLLIELISSSLISLGVPSSWDNVAIGALILLGAAFQLIGRKSALVPLPAGAR